MFLCKTQFYYSKNKGTFIANLAGPSTILRGKITDFKLSI